MAKIDVKDLINREQLTVGSKNLCDIISTHLWPLANSEIRTPSHICGISLLNVTLQYLKYRRCIWSYCFRGTCWNSSVIDKERRGDYLGKRIEVLPNITNVVVVLDIQSGPAILQLQVHTPTLMETPISVAGIVALLSGMVND